MLLLNAKLHVAAAPAKIVPARTARAQYVQEPRGQPPRGLAAALAGARLAPRGAALAPPWSARGGTFGGAQARAALRRQPKAMPVVARHHRIASVMVTAAATNEQELLIVGPGVLGSLVGVKWMEKFPGARVVGQTNTNSRHEELVKLGLEPRLKADASEEQFPNVIFCAPPSGSDDYTAEIAAAAKLWNGKGTFVFTSSSAVYSEEQGVVYREDSPTVTPGNPRVDRLLDAEAVVLEAGGCVLRLAGLYHAQRGAHTYYLKTGEVAVRGDGVLNLIHYEDAASLSVAAIASGAKGQVFMGCDNSPVTKADMMGAIYANASEKYGDLRVTFTGTSGSLGRVMDNSNTREVLKWTPKYSSFQAFMVAYGNGETSWEVEGAAHQD